MHITFMDPLSEIVMGLAAWKAVELAVLVSRRHTRRRVWFKITDFAGFMLLVHGPEACRDPYTRFGAWCLDHAGGWAYRDYSAI